MTQNDAVGLKVPDPPPGRQWFGRFTAEELTNEAYHAGPGVSKSHLDTIAGGSPRHYWQRYVNPERPIEVKTPALVLGDAIHAAILQPQLFETAYAAKPEGLDKRTKEGKAQWANFLEAHSDKKHISHDQFVCCINIREVIYRHPVARGLLVGGVSEHSFFTKYRETGDLVKCRADYLTGDYVIDLKSTLDASEDSFSRDATSLRYDVAVPWYMDIIADVTGQRPRKWIWLAVEKEPPYALAIYTAQDHDIVRARDTARRNFLNILQHRKANAWPDYGETIRPLELKPWAKR
jgi:hypothetical protein